MTRRALARTGLIGAAIPAAGALAHSGQAGHVHLEAAGGLVVSPAGIFLAVLGLSVLATAAGVLLGEKLPRVRAD